MWSNEYKSIEVYPGENFIIHLIALGQTGYPVPVRIQWERFNDTVTDIGHCLSPPSQIICTSISFQLHSEKFGYTAMFKLYPQNAVCQNLVDGLILGIKVLCCSLGFAF